MDSRDGYDNARFSDVDLADAMYHGNPVTVPPPMSFGGDPLHEFERHRLVRLVLEGKNFLPIRVIPRCPNKDVYCAGVGRFDRTEDFVEVERGLNDLEHEIGCRFKIQDAGCKSKCAGFMRQA